MSFEIHEYDPTPPPMSPVKRFYSDLKTVEGNYVNLQISAQKMIAAELGMPDHGLSSLYGDVLPTYDLHGSNRRKAMEMFMTFPLDLLGPWIDMAKPTEEMVSWYDEVALFIHSATTRGHTDACYQIMPERGCSCYASERCPRRVLGLALVVPDVPDFASEEYVLDPYRMREIALAKLEVAERRGVITQKQHVLIGTHYTCDFEDRFGPVPHPEEKRS